MFAFTWIRNNSNVSCLFRNFRVLSNVSYLGKDRMEACAKDLEKAIDTVAPEADGPAAIVFCGSKSEQQKMSEMWKQIKNKEWGKVPCFQSSPDAIARLSWYKRR